MGDVYPCEKPLLDNSATNNIPNRIWIHVLNQKLCIMKFVDEYRLSEKNSGGGNVEYKNGQLWKPKPCPQSMLLSGVKLFFHIFKIGLFT